MDEARRIARILLKKRIAACVNLVPNIGSWYWWKGRVEQGKEVLLLIKTSRSRLNLLSDLLKKSHSYELPELIALPIVWGDQGYLSWLSRTLTAPSSVRKILRR